MAIFAATDYNVTVAGTDFSDHLSSVELPLSAADLPTTDFGSGGWEESISGLKSGNVSLNFHQDFAASSVDSTLWTNFGAVVAVVVKPTSAAVGATNPSFTFNARINNITPISASVGDLAVQQLTWPITASVTRATS